MHTFGNICMVGEFFSTRPSTCNYTSRFISKKKENSVYLLEKPSILSGDVKGEFPAEPEALESAHGSCFTTKLQE